MPPSNPYQILGIHPSADGEEIKQAYRRLAKKYHPDHNPGNLDSENRFKEVCKAYQILSDPRRRSVLDHKRRAAQAAGADKEAPPDFPQTFEDIFENLFSPLDGRPSPPPVCRGERGRDLKHHLTIDLETVVTGAIRPIRVERLETCGQCRGRGTELPHQPERCVVCAGQGAVRQRQGLLERKAPCRACGGTGRVQVQACTRCGGTGRTRNSTTVKVSIPPGVEGGTQIRLRGQGDVGTGDGGPGDLLVTIGLLPHLQFTRESADLRYTLNLDMVAAALGTQASIPTLEGIVPLKIPAGTQSGSTFRIRGQGLPWSPEGPRGDLIVAVRVKTPTRLSERQQQLLREFAHRAPPAQPTADPFPGPHPSASGLFARLRTRLRRPGGRKNSR